jgi:hypothetical protein
VKLELSHQGNNEVECVENRVLNRILGLRRKEVRGSLEKTVQ